MEVVLSHLKSTLLCLIKSPYAVFTLLLSACRVQPAPQALKLTAGGGSVLHSSWPLMTFVTLRPYLPKGSALPLWIPRASLPSWQVNKLHWASAHAGVRPIGICETATRIVTNAVLFATKGDLQDAAGSQQLCAGKIGWAEAGFHVMGSTFLSADTEAVLLVDTSNAFNSLNWQVALHNTRFICPFLAKVLINAYQDASELFIDDQVLRSEEGTTQSDSLAIPMYAMPLLYASESSHQQSELYT